MCGIAGVIDIYKTSPSNEILELAVKMADTMIHRGPDDKGEWQSPDGRAAFAHRRLAIIDLTPGGRQPMIDASVGLSIVYNGEIYNYIELRDELMRKGHQFRTESDTEVLLTAYKEWGDACLEHLDGMFAFAIYDEQNGKAFLARDRAGEKPLYYRLSNCKLIFASELKAIMADPSFSRELDFESLDFYLAYGYVPGGKCILKGVKKLPPAHYLSFNLHSGKAKIERYWDLPRNASTEFDEDSLLEELQCLISNSVRRRLMADVPVGVLLSGGLDSSLVTAFAAKVSSRTINTFTISFPGHAKYDEGPYAKIVAEKFGTNHTELPAEETSLDLLPKLIRQFDEPIADHSLLPTYMVSRLVREKATVALGGDGGDELFGGYGHYSFIQSHERLKAYTPKPLRSTVSFIAKRVLPVGSRGRNHLIAFGGELSQSISHINMYFDAFIRRKLLGPALKNAILSDCSPEEWKASLCNEAASVLQAATRADFYSTLPDDYLVKVDRSSMLASLEIRAPFLDHKLVEWAFAKIPDCLRATANSRKVLLKKLAEKILPPQLDLNRKQGFTIPLANWFKGEWGAYFEEVLNEAEPQLFDKNVISMLVNGQKKGLNNANRLFALTMFELWRREYSIKTF